MHQKKDAIIFTIYWVLSIKPSSILGTETNEGRHTNWISACNMQFWQLSSWLWHLRFSEHWLWAILSSGIWLHIIWQQCSEDLALQSWYTFTRLHGATSQKTSAFIKIILIHKMSNQNIYMSLKCVNYAVFICPNITMCELMTLILE